MSTDKPEPKAKPEKAKTFTELAQERENFMRRMTWEAGDLVLLESDPREKPKKATGVRLKDKGLL
jgi:hypothetical protein